MTTPRMRVKAPKNAIKGEIVEIMTMISHPMDTGLRKDKQGIIIPRNIVNKFVCKYMTWKCLSLICTKPFQQIL